MSIAPAINEESFEPGCFFHILLRYVWVAVYIHTIMFLLNVHFEGVDKLICSNCFIAGVVVVAGNKLSPVLLLPVFITGVVVIGN